MMLYVKMCTCHTSQEEHEGEESEGARGKRGEEMNSSSI